MFLSLKKADNTLGHQVYRKPTHTDRYLHAKSHHHPAQKQSAINSLVRRAFTISDKDTYRRNSTIWNKLYKRTDMIKKL